MKDKIISGIIGAILGAFIVLGYGYFDEKESSNNMEKPDISKREVSYDQIERIVEKTGLTEEEIKSRIEEGETPRDIMGGEGGSGRGGKGSGINTQ